MSNESPVCFITGAGSGIGRHIALALGVKGYRVAICDINPDAAQETLTLLHQQNSGEGLVCGADVTNESDVNDAFKTVIQKWGRLDTLVSNAGIQIVHPIEDFPYEDFKRVVDIHLNGAFLTTKAAVKYMYPQKSGLLLYMGSVHSHEASPLKSAYVAAKHGILGLARVMAKEGAPHGVRTNVICPGFVKTPLVEKQIPEQAQALGLTEKEVIENIMLKGTVDKQFTTLEDVANLAVFLSEFPSSALTGQSITVSHGWNMN